jgi:bifunctional non-homologous end joining protein LigD
MPTKLPDVDPVSLLPWAKPFDGPDWMFEPKYDGFRALLYASTPGCEFRTSRSHRGERVTELGQRVARVLAGRQAILDGEIVALDPKGKPVFRDLLKGRGYLAFAASDLLWLEGEDLRALPLAVRKRRLADLLPSDTGPLYKIFTLEDHGRALYETSRRMDLEGVVAKRAGDAYGAETPWYLIRNPAFRQSEAGEGTPSGLRRKVLPSAPPSRATS